MSDNIKVVVKVRPLVKRELDDGLVVNWCTDRERIWPKGCTKDSYTFDAVFGETCTTKDVYQEVAGPIVEAALNGINGTIFAYGQTSSGKTYTMMGTPDSPGIIPLAVDQIFKFKDDNADRAFFLRISFIEIYNERMKDLLDIKNTDLKIQEKDGCWQVTNCREIVTNSTKDVMTTFEKGNTNRSVGETLMNDASSRSHTIFKITIESRKHIIPGSEEDDCVIYSTLNLVDLAGSERASQTGATKERLREGGHINKSLVTLCRVIRQLSNAQGDPNRFINYRDSKLTHMLQSSLGGNAKTGIICAVTPATLEETHSTLKFAMCAKVIENKPIVNAVISDAKQHKILQERLSELQKELESKKLVEEDNVRLSEKIAILKAQISIGFGKRDILQSNTIRRRTWCAPNLQSISEDSTVPIDFDNRKDKFNAFKSNLVSQFITENRKEITTSATNNDSNESIEYISDSDVSPNKNSLLNPCSPEHKCFNVVNTPPCVLRERIKHGQQELKDLEEFTTLEKIYGPKETELISHFNKVKEDMDKALNDRNETIKRYEENMKVLQQEFESLKNKHNNVLKSQETLSQTNIDLEYKLENTISNHQKKVADLLSSLEEARKNSRFPKIDQLNTMCSDNIFNSSNKEIGEREFSSLDEKIITDKDLELISKVEKYCELECKYQILNDQIEALNFELKEKTLLNDILEKKCIEQESTQDSHFSTLEAVKSEIKLLNRNLVVSNLKLQNSEKEKLYLINENHKLKQDLEVLQNEKIISINDAGSKSFDQLNIANEKITQLNSVIFELNLSIVDLEKKCDELRENAQSSECIILNLNSEINDLKCESSKSIDLKNLVIEDLQKQLNLSKDIIEDYVSQISKLNAENDSITNLKNDIENELHKIKEAASIEKVSNDSLKKEIEKLNSEILNVTCEVEHLLVESKELEEKTSCQFREQQVTDAEFSLLKSELAASQHYHNSLHSTCESTIANLKNQLLLLQSFLQGKQSFSDSMNITGLTPRSFFSKLSLCEDFSIVEETSNPDDSISTGNLKETITICSNKNVENFITDETISIDYKMKYHELIECVQKKDSENSSLIKGCEELNDKIKTLERENDALSLELMEYIQELDMLKQKNTSNILNEKGVNTSLCNNSVKDASVNCNISEIFEDWTASPNIESIPSELHKDSQTEEDSLQRDIDLYKSKNDELNAALAEMNLKYETLSKIQNNLNELLEQRQTEIDNLKISIDKLKNENEEIIKIKNDILVKELSNNQLVDSLQQQILSIQSEMKLKSEELANQEQQLLLITKKYEDLDVNCNKITSDYESEKLHAENKQKSLLEEIDNLKTSLSLVENEKTIALGININLKNEIETCQLSLAEKDNKHSIELKNIQLEVSVLNKELTNLKNEIVNKESEINKYSKLEQDKIQAINECKVLKDQLNIYEVSLAEKDTALQDLVELREKSKTLVNKIDQLKSDLDEKDQILKNSEEKLKEKHLIAANYAELVNQLRDLFKLSSTTSIDLSEKTPEEIICHLRSNLLDCQFQTKQNSKMSIDLEEFRLSNENIQIELNAANEKYNIILAEKKLLESFIESLSKILSLDDSIKLEDLNQVVTRVDMLVSNVDKLRGITENSKIHIESLQEELCEMKILHDKYISEKREIVKTCNAANESISILESRIGVLEIFVSKLFKSIEIFNNEELKRNYEFSFGNLEKEYIIHDKILKDVKNKILLTEENNNKLHDRLQYMETQLEENKEKTEILIQEKELIEKELEEMKSKASNCKLPASYSDFFVDKMSHNVVLDNNKELQKANDDLRWKYRDLMADFRRLQHTVQNNTMNNLLPQNGEDIAKLKERNAVLEKELQALQVIEKSYSELKDQCKLYNEEYEICIRTLEDRDSVIKRLSLEKSNAEKRLAELSTQLVQERMSRPNPDYYQVEKLKDSLEKKEKELQTVIKSFRELNEKGQMYKKEYETCAKDFESKIEKLTLERSNLEKKVVELSRQMVKERMDKSKHFSEYKEVKASLEKSEKELQTLQTVQKSYEELKEKYEACVQTLKDSESKMEKLSSEKLDAENKCVEISKQWFRERMNQPKNISEYNQIVNLKASLEKRENELKTLQTVQKAYEELKEKYETCVKALTDSKLKIEKLTSEKLNNEKKIAESLISPDRNIFENLKASLEKKEQELKNLQLRYDEVDEECEMCAQRLREKEEHCNLLYSEKKILQARVTNLELELKEHNENSAQQERKKKRQSLVDMNRGCLTPSPNNSGTESNGNNTSFESISLFRKITELENDKKTLQAELHNLNAKYKGACDQVKELMKAIPRSITTKTVECQETNENVLSPRKLVDQNLNTQPVNSVGSAIVLNQRLSEYIAENERLVNINNKLKHLCRMRDKKIKELEKDPVDKEN